MIGCLLVEEIHETREKRAIEVKFEISDPFCRNLACFTLADIYKQCLVQAVCSRKTWTVAIFSQLSLSEIRLWKLAQARCYKPVSPCKDFHHQDFSMIAVDTQE